MAAPFEILAGTCNVYTAPVDEARPDLEDAPAGNWTLLGTNGDQNYGEDGIVITPSESFTEFNSLGSTGVQKAFRTLEELTIAIPVHDMTTETIAMIFGNLTLTETAPGAGTAGVRDIDLLRGSTVNERGLLLRWDVSPYITAAKMQIWVPRGYFSELGAFTASKGDAMGATVTFKALESTSNGYGKFEAQDEQGV